MFADETAATAEVATENPEVATEQVETLVQKDQEPIRKPKSQKAEGFKMLPYFENAKVVCACGNNFTTGSTKEEIRVEICSNCHPFFTGQEKFVDTEGRVERFKRIESAKLAPKAKKEVDKKDERPKSLKEMLMSLENK